MVTLAAEDGTVNRSLVLCFNVIFDVSDDFARRLRKAKMRSENSGSPALGAAVGFCPNTPAAGWPRLYLAKTKIGAQSMASIHLSPPSGLAGLLPE